MGNDLTFMGMGSIIEMSKNFNNVTYRTRLFQKKGGLYPFFRFCVAGSCEKQLPLSHKMRRFVRCLRTNWRPFGHFYFCQN